MGPVRDKEQFENGMKGVVQEWAQIAEENGVELFSPTCELIIFQTLASG